MEFRPFVRRKHSNKVKPEQIWPIFNLHGRVSVIIYFLQTLYFTATYRHYSGAKQAHLADVTATNNTGSY